MCLFVQRGRGSLVFLRGKTAMNGDCEIYDKGRYVAC